MLTGGFRLMRKLAEGGVASVWMAEAPGGLEVAVKVLHPELSQHADVRRRFAQEGYLANQIDHPGVVRVQADGFTDDGLPFIVMDLLRGRSLEAAREGRGGRLTVAEVALAMRDVLGVLETAHRSQILHRDIKPDNLFITEAGEVKVLDFGIARMMQTLNMETTKTGLLIGTAEFMSPEQARGQARDLDVRVDVWGVGATMFMLLTGEPVFPGNNIADVLRKTLEGKARPLSFVLPDVPPFLAAVVDRALAFDRNARWESAKAMRDALERVTKSFDPGVLRVLGTGGGQAETLDEVRGTNVALTGRQVSIDVAEDDTVDLADSGFITMAVARGAIPKFSDENASLERTVRQEETVTGVAPSPGGFGSNIEAVYESGTATNLHEVASSAGLPSVVPPEADVHEDATNVMPSGELAALSAATLVRASYPDGAKIQGLERAGVMRAAPAGGKASTPPSTAPRRASERPSASPTPSRRTPPSAHPVALQPGGPQPVALQSELGVPHDETLVSAPPRGGATPGQGAQARGGQNATAMSGPGPGPAPLPGSQGGALPGPPARPASMPAPVGMGHPQTVGRAHHAAAGFAPVTTGASGPAYSAPPATATAWQGPTWSLAPPVASAPPARAPSMHSLPPPGANSPWPPLWISAVLLAMLFPLALAGALVLRDL
jgi:serine/threonine-protein kinase